MSKIINPKISSGFYSKQKGFYCKPLLLQVIFISATFLSFSCEGQLASPEKDKLNEDKKEAYIKVEAEGFLKQSKSDVRKWYKTSKNESPSVGRDEDENHSATASNGAYLEILPDTRVTHDDLLIRSENFSNKAGEMAILHYEVEIPTPGRYYVWVRAFSTGSEDNGIHVGLNGEWPASGERMQWCEGKKKWTWESKQRTVEEHCGVPFQIYLDIDKAGTHEIQFSMREDGFEFDAFILTKDKDFLASNIQAKVNAPAGRIAIVADGNSPDPDDLGGTAISLGLLRAAGLENRLVHYSHSCDLVRNQNISQKAEKERHYLMASTCEITARRWAGFENLSFLDAKWQQSETVEDLVKAINSSSQDDPLWIIEAGEPDIIGMALSVSDDKKHSFVKVVTHHPANDNAGDYYSWQQILDFGVEEVRIPDQNINLKVNEEEWNWARDHEDPRIKWIWLIGKIAENDDVVKFQKGKWDCSDAGMVLYWITGALDGGLRAGSVEQVKNLLLSFVSKNN